ncbi:uncharacterized protein LOC134805531 [Cydia splendana]|uniref:uncharacterized protein LOC134805531 n=1 Tax=Cydia splendana TaxID=1100963 RepID=UPI00300C4788
MQVITEWGVSLAVVAEPWCIPPRTNWVGATDDKVALVMPAIGDFPPLTKVHTEPGIAAAKWENIILIGTYFSPNRPLPAFERHLENLAVLIRRVAPTPVLLMGDLNAKSATWGSPITDPRGATLRDWAATMGLITLNQGNANTCVRRQGGSIVDVTFATPVVAARVGDWRVLGDIETLSDHVYIRMRVSSILTAVVTRGGQRRAGRELPRWSLAQLDRTMVDEAAMMEAWNAPSPDVVGTEARAISFRSSLTTICDAAIPALGDLLPKIKFIGGRRR